MTKFLRSPDGPWVASASRVITFAIVTPALAVTLVACGAGLARPADATPIGSLPLGTTGLDCADLARRAPDDAADLLSSAGYSVVWRLVHTTSDGSSVADVVQSAPEGVIVDIVIADDEAIVFVADPGDPSAGSPPPPAC